uniref:Pre-mRNA 3'-end-processing endonuclease polyadenylation factor C-term domain-containing protein n=1 Tax=Moniliophthora roreri TaxID=221103 RepID=A0A0W0FGU9_MONRR
MTDPFIFLALEILMMTLTPFIFVQDIMTEPDEFESVKGGMIPRKISVDYISFSAHVDYSQNSEFIEAVKAQHVVLVHGEQTAMGRLRAAMTSRYKERDEDVKIHTPRNLETLNLSFRGERVAKAIGTLADKPPQPNDVLSGLLVAKDYSYTLLDPRDLKDFAGLSTCTVSQKQRIALGVGWELVRWHLEGMYGHVEEGVDKEGIPTLRAMGAIDIKLTSEHELTLEWESSASVDMIADSTLALITGIDKSPASVKVTNHLHSHSHSHPHADNANETSLVPKIGMFLEAHFGFEALEYHEPDLTDEDEQGEEERYPAFVVTLPEGSASVNLNTLAVSSVNETLKKRLEVVVNLAVTTVTSLSQAFRIVAPASHEEANLEQEPAKAVVIPKEEALRLEEISQSKPSDGSQGDEGASSNENVHD